MACVKLLHQLGREGRGGQGWSLLAAGPFLDKLVSGSWVVTYAWSRPALYMLALSCTAAVGVNVSQFLCLGRFSAMTFQVGVCSSPAAGATFGY